MDHLDWECLDVTINSTEVSASTLGTASTTREPYHYYGDIERAFDVFFLVIMICTGTLGNLLIIIAFYKDQTLRSAGDVIVINITVVDSIISMEYLPLVLAAVVAKENILPDAWCDFHGFLVILLSVVSINSLACLAIYRGVIVLSRPIHRRFFRLRNTPVLLLIVWILGFVLSTPPLLGWGDVGYVTDSFNCALDYKENISYTLFLYCIALGIPLIVTFTSYTWIFYAIKQTEARVRNSSPDMYYRHKSKHFGHKHLLSSFILSALFLVLWMPYCITTVVDHYNSVDPFAIKTTTWLGLFNSCINSYVFLWVNRHYREALKQTAICKILWA